MKTNITIDNYEAFLLDQLEGNLSPADEKALDAFLTANPELKTEVEGIQLYYLEPEESVIFPNKETLKKKKSGRVIGIGTPWRWYQIAAAAAILGAVVLIWSLQPNDQSQTIAPLAEQPEVVIPVDTNDQHTTDKPEQTQDPATEPSGEQKESNQSPALPPLRLQMPTQGNTEEIAQKTDESRFLPELRPLQKTFIEEVELLQNQFRTEEVARYEPIRPTNLQHEPDRPLQEQGNRLLNTILSNEVARNFLPEAVEDEIPNPRRDKGDNTIILEVPSKGKKIIDNILNR